MSRKRVLKESNPSVFLGGGRKAHTFRLDVREDESGRQEYFSKRVRPVFARHIPAFVIGMVITSASVVAYWIGFWRGSKFGVQYAIDKLSEDIKK